MVVHSSGSLLFSLGRQCCALPLEIVAEVMRPQPLVPVESIAPGVAGLALIRGRHVPVIDLAALIGLETLPPQRLITIRVNGRLAALAVEGVRGVRSFERSVWQALPPLLSTGTTPFDAVATLDGELVLRLSAVRIVPEGGAQ